MMVTDQSKTKLEEEIKDLEESKLRDEKKYKS